MTRMVLSCGRSGRRARGLAAGRTGRGRVLAVLAGAVAVWGAVALAAAGPAAGGAVLAAGSWGRAIEVPGLGALNTGNAGVTSVSCASAGNCAASGDYTDGDRRQQGFVAVERNGIWGTAFKLPGLAALSGGDAGVTSVSCGSAGNCAAGGYVIDGRAPGFVVTERNGVWGKAIKVPGLAALSKAGFSGVDSVSCAPAGGCAAGGIYTGAHGTQQSFVVTERHGAWGTAVEVPGLGAMNKGGFAEVSSVSCASGGCAAGGDYTGGSGHGQGFVATERHGAWSKAIKVPGLAALDAGRFAGVESVSCASADNCAAGGFYADASVHTQVFVATEKNCAEQRRRGRPVPDGVVRPGRPLRRRRVLHRRLRPLPGIRHPARIAPPARSPRQARRPCRKTAARHPAGTPQPR